MRYELNAIYVIISRELIKFTREKGRLIPTLIRPLLWLFLVGGGMSKLVSPDMEMPYMQFIFPGIIGMTVLFSSIFSSISIIWDKEFGFLKEMLVAPVSRFSIVVGKAFSGTIISTIQALIILLLFPLLGFKLTIYQIFFTLCIAALLALCISSLGILIAVFYENIESFSAIMNFIVFPMFFLSGAMYPVKLMPEVLGFFAIINPLTYGVDALKYMIFPEKKLLTHDFPFSLDIIVLLLTSLFFVTVAAYAFEKKK